MASLPGSVIPTNSKTVRRSRQFPAIAPGMAALACLISSYSFKSSMLSGDGSVFRSFGAGLFAGFVPRLAPWAVFFRRSAAGSVLTLSWDAFTCAGCGAAFVSRWAGAFAATRAGTPALRASGVGCGSGPGVGLICSFFDSMGGRIRGVRSGIGGRSRGLRGRSVVPLLRGRGRRSGHFLRSWRRCAGLE